MSIHDEIVITEDEFEPSRPKWRFPWKRILISLGVLALVAVLFVLFNVFRVTALPFSLGALKGESSGRINILLLGVGDPGHEGPDLSDTNIVVSVNPKTHQVANISIPRDLRVKIPGQGSAKINSANVYGGVDMARKVVEETLGIPIHYYLKANFSGLSQVVDAVGGVDIDNPTDLSDPEYPCDKNQYRSCGFRLKAGHYHMNGSTALKYVRCRKGTCGDDFGRAARQQQVMQAIRGNATSLGTLGNPIKLGSLVSAAGSNLQTDLSVNNVLRLNDLTKQTDKNGKPVAKPDVISVVFSLEPDGFLVASTNSSDLLPADGDFTAIREFVKNIFTVGPIWSEHPMVIIQNGTLTPGIASKFEQKLTSDGYNVTVVAVANALTQDHVTTQIIDYTAGGKSHTVSYLQGILKATATPPATPVKVPPADIVIILGQDYASSLIPKSTTSSPTPK